MIIIQKIKNKTNGWGEGFRKEMNEGHKDNGKEVNKEVRRK